MRGHARKTKRAITKQHQTTCRLHLTLVRQSSVGLFHACRHAGTNSKRWRNDYEDVSSKRRRSADCRRANPRAHHHPVRSLRERQAAAEVDHVCWKGIIKNHLTPALGHLPLQQLTYLHLEQYYAEAGLKFAPATVAVHRSMLTCALNAAVNVGHLRQD